MISCSILIHICSNAVFSCDIFVLMKSPHHTSTQENLPQRGVAPDFPTMKPMGKKEEEAEGEKA